MTRAQSKCPVCQTWEDYRTNRFGAVVILCGCGAHPQPIVHPHEDLPPKRRMGVQQFRCQGCGKLRKGRKGQKNCNHKCALKGRRKNGATVGGHSAPLYVTGASN